METVNRDELAVFLGEPIGDAIVGRCLVRLLLNHLVLIFIDVVGRACCRWV